MATQVITLRQNDTAPNIPITCTRNGVAIDLTGATVKFKIANSTGNRTNDAHNACTITTASAGTCTYDLATGDIPSADTYTGDVEITYANGEIETQTHSAILNVLAKS